MPALNTEARHSLELTEIPGYENGVQSSGLGGYEGVEGADALATRLKVVSDRGVVSGIGPHKRFDGEDFRELRQPESGFSAGTFGNAKFTLGENEDGQAEVIKRVLHALDQARRITAHVGRQGIGVRQVNHSSRGRSETACGGTSCSSGQEPAREMKALRLASQSESIGSSNTPRSVFETRTTEPGNRNSRGNRTA